MAAPKFYTPRRMPQSGMAPADLTQRNLDLIANAFAALSNYVSQSFIPVPTPPSPTPTGSKMTAKYSFAGSSEQDSSGAEVAMAGFQLSEDFSQFGPSIAVLFTGYTSSAGGPGTFRIRIGGTDGGVNGAIACSIAQPSATALSTPIGIGLFANPGGILPIKLTIQSHAATQKAAIRNMVLTLVG